MADPLFINASAGAPAYSANELRQGMALGLAYDGRNMGARQGVRPGGDQLFVSLAVSTITIQPGVACVDPGLSTPQGPYWVAIPVAETQTLSPADATNPRKDIIICRVYDHDEDASGLRLARSEYLVGTPGPSPAEPAVPAGAIKLALIDVPATPGTPVVTDRRPWTVAPGGILPVAAAGDITAGTEGRYRDRLDTNLLERDSGAAWETVADPTLFKAWTTYTPTWTGTTTNPVIGNGTISAAYRQIGKTVWYRGFIVAGSTTTFGSGSWEISWPVTPTSLASSNGGFVGTAYVLDFSAGATWSAAIISVSTTALRIVVTNAASSGNLTPTTPMTWATSDRFSWSLMYEVP